MRKFSYIAIALAVVLLLYYSFSTDSRSGTYEAFITEEREKKIEYLKSSSQSPFVQMDQKVGELTYYPINQKYQLSARVEKFLDRQYVMIQNSDGTTLRYMKYAWLKFELNDQNHQLLVLKPMFGLGLFLGFADETSGLETYGGGRYLDLEQINGDRVTLDFNLAYNPYCAYVANFTCPLPPSENVLKTSIEAGELDYGKTK